ncbi:MAG TPA: DNA helicase UvrD [Caldithrix abyssi]|uniref:DNA 3'-5' helicase n=1 Tax=Caldithrix abyssi TaxID=187145 RepID=A0A7V4U0H6_CALAY|nr:DNA helicase UvrD [Caldithrix abyssi]
MKFIADLHIHSHYSIATSKQLIPEYLDYWARIKGITVVGSGDFTHPGWLKELKEKLEPAEEGLFRLKEQFRPQAHSLPLPAPTGQTRFMLTAEISNIYKKDGRLRKVHNLIFAPDFETAEKIQSALAQIGNIASDGRPILGLDSRDLLEIALNCSERIFFVPAHIWTPWFSALGAKSGFDSIEACYGDLSDHIYAVETGLSSDPPMNRMCGFLDKYTLISNSDAHSPEKLGREANLFECGLSYSDITETLKGRDGGRFLGTVEFFPQEGKYHYDGHRKCKVCWDPLQTLQNDGRCPVCGKMVTVGVMHRVARLADRDHTEMPDGQPPFYSLIPLKELLSELYRSGPASKKVSEAYLQLIKKTGSEFNVLLHWPLDELSRVANELLVEGLRRMRSGQVRLSEGYDGEFGRIRVFDEKELRSISSQTKLFAPAVKETETAYNGMRHIRFDIAEYRRLFERKRPKQLDLVEVLNEKKEAQRKTHPLLAPLNREQRAAVEYESGPARITAGPGTGKTRVLTTKIAWLIKVKKQEPCHILAVTFTNRAAREMRERLQIMLDSPEQSQALTVTTFHALGFRLLQERIEETRVIIDETEKQRILLRELDCPVEEVKEQAARITRFKQTLTGPEKSGHALYQSYQRFLDAQRLYDMDDLISRPVFMLRESPDFLEQIRERYRRILVDEFQDINEAQYQLLRLLAPPPRPDLFVIGDPNQAIYGFRGASAQFIPRFAEDYPQAAAFTLHQSYRCSQSVLRASHNVVASGPMLKGLQEGVKITIAPQSSDKSEAEFIARRIEQMLGGVRFFSIDSEVSDGQSSEELQSLGDFAVLVRTSRQMRLIEKAFADHSIPWQSAGDELLFHKEPLRSLLDILRFTDQPDHPYLRKKWTSLVGQEPSAMVGELGALPLKERITRIAALFFAREFDGKTDRLEALLQFAGDFSGDVKEFLQAVTLGSSIDAYQPDSDRVALLTLHAAKGLEFKCVFIAGCEDGLLPYALSGTSPADTEEERRLLYVGMTRAQKYLILTHSRRRFLMGRSLRMRRSPFLDAIEKELIDLYKSTYTKSPSKDTGQLNLFG